MSRSPKSQLDSKASRKAMSGAGEPSSTPHPNTSSPPRSSKESTPDSSHHNHTNHSLRRHSYHTQDPYYYLTDRMNRSPYYYPGSHHSSMESLASQDSIQQMIPPYTQQFLVPSPHYFYPPAQHYTDGIFALEPIITAPPFSVADTQMFAPHQILHSPQVLIPDMSTHYDMPTVMVPVHPDYQSDPTRAYHIPSVPDGSQVESNYPEVHMRMGYYGQGGVGDIQEMYRQPVSTSGHWNSPPTAHRDRDRGTSNGIRREKRPESADSSYSGAHSDSTQFYSSRYNRRSHESPPSQPPSSDVLGRLKRHFNPKTLDGIPLKEARFFVIKSYSEQDIRQSIRHEIWTSTESGNKRLDNAFRDQGDRPIYLYFSVNASGHFCGVAQMTSEVDLYVHTGIFSQDKWKGKFRVRWLFIKDIPNQHLRRVKLSNNEGKPITNSRDCQEVLYEQGMETMRLILEYAASTCMLDDLDYGDLNDEMKRIAKKERYSTGTK